MKTVYRTSFPFSGLQQGDDALAVAAQVCLRWAVDRDEVAAPHHTLWQRGTAVEGEFDLGDGYLLETRRASFDGKQAWAMRFKHPHKDYDGVHREAEWCAEIGLLNANGKSSFSFSLGVGRSDGAIAPVRFFPSCPRIVSNFLDALKCGGAIRLFAKPFELDGSSEGVQLFTRLLGEPSRRHPIVFITPRSFQGDFVADYKAVVEMVAGLAHVVVASNPDTTKSLSAVLPAHLNCFDGGVRLYWPGFSTSQSPYAHPLWPWWEIQARNGKHPRAFAQEVLGRISSVAIFSTNNEFLSWATLDSFERAKAITEAKAKGDVAGELELFMQENKALEATTKQLQRERDELLLQLRNAESRIAAYEAAFEQSKSAASTDQQAELPLKSVAEAKQRAEEKFGDRLVFALNTKSNPDTPFESPDEVFDALVWLANGYFESKAGRISGKPLSDSIREVLPDWSYSGGQSDQTVGEFRSWYECQCDGQKWELGEHIGTGSSKDARYTIRIGFTWDKAAERVIIGFIGQHQRTRKT